MKIKFKKLTAILSVIACFISLDSVFSQVYERYVEYSVDTLYLKPRSNRILVNVGSQLDANGDGSHKNNLGLYGYGRIDLTKVMFSALIAMPIPGFNYNNAYASDYSVQEATAVWCFGGDGNKKKKAGVTTDNYGRDTKLFYTGGKFKEIINVTTTTTTYGSYGIGTTTKSTAKGKKKGKSYAELSVPKHSSTGLSVGIFNWVRPNDISGIARVSGFAFGLVSSSNQKAKYRFHYQVKGNTCTSVGGGKYSVEPNGKVYKTGKNNAKINQTIDFGMEFLYAPKVSFQNSQYLHRTDLDSIGKMEDIKKKNFGFRFRIEAKRGPISMRYEVGLRPGVKYRVGGDAGEDNFATRMMGGAYMLMGFGIALGAW